MRPTVSLTTTKKATSVGALLKTMKTEVDGNKQVFKYTIAGETVCRAHYSLSNSKIAKCIENNQPSHTNGEAINS